MFALSAIQRDASSWDATLELEGSFAQPESNIDAILTAVESLPPDAMKIWSACTVREFNLGYACGDEPWAFTNQLTSPTLARMAALGASLRLTLYPFRASNEPTGGPSQAPASAS